MTDTTNEQSLALQFPFVREILIDVELSLINSVNRSVYVGRQALALPDLSAFIRPHVMNHLLIWSQSSSRDGSIALKYEGFKRVS